MTVVHRSDLGPEDDFSQDPWLALADLDRWLADPTTRQAVLDICECASPERTLMDRSRSARGSVAAIRAALEDAFKRGDLVIIIEHTVAGAGVAEEEEIVPQLRRPAKQPPSLTWIAINLVDMVGQPVPGTRYRLELPDGSFQEGQLDDEGRARVDEIDPGACKITFPDLDADAWEPA